MNFKSKNFVAIATSATAVARAIPEFQQKCVVVRRLFASGNDAAAALTWYIPQRERSFNLPVKLAANGTLVRVPVDVAGGHVFQGKTLTTGFKLLLPFGADGWTLVTVSAVNDVTSANYCTLTISAVGVVIAQGSKAYLLDPATDVLTGIPAVGAANVSAEYVLTGSVGAPVVFAAVATTDKQCLASAYVEWQD